jgi:predicted nucleic acid-binding protein
MKKLKLYLDTSVISHLDAPDTPDKQEDTRKLWKAIQRGEYEVAISSVTERELVVCGEPKRSTLFRYLGQVSYSVIPLNEQMLVIADKVVELGILTPKSIDDCRHIAAAIVCGCDVIVSWNFKHIVNHKTIQGIKAVTAITGFPEVLIYTPTILMGGELDDS